MVKLLPELLYFGLTGLLNGIGPQKNSVLFIFLPILFTDPNRFSLGPAEESNEVCRFRRGQSDGKPSRILTRSQAPTENGLRQLPEP